MPKVVQYALALIVIILAVTCSVIAIQHGVEFAVVAGLLTTILGVLVPSPLLDIE